MNGYPNGTVLTEIEWLTQHFQDPKLVVLDVRASDPRLPVGYRMGHIPGAVALDPGSEFFVIANGAPTLVPPDKIGHPLGQRGITNDTSVVIYDEWTGQLAALTYWALRYIGHAKVSVLHGGWAAWRAAGNPTTRDLPAVTPTAYRPETNTATRATAEWIQQNTSRPDMMLLDVRTTDEFARGRIPNAVNLPYDVSLDVRTQTFKDEDTLRRQLESAGVTPEKEIVTYCAAGARSAHMFLTLQLLGYPRVRNYDGSMIDWYNVRHLPVE